jgi:hypothetical protein
MSRRERWSVRGSRLHGSSATEIIPAELSAAGLEHLRERRKLHTRSRKPDKVESLAILFKRPIKPIYVGNLVGLIAMGERPHCKTIRTQSLAGLKPRGKDRRPVPPPSLPAKRWVEEPAFVMC